MYMESLIKASSLLYDKEICDIMNKLKPEIFRSVPQPYAFVMGFYNDRWTFKRKLWT